jgi:hypothetical protein
MDKFRFVNYNFDVEYPSWRVCTRYIFQFITEESVTTNTFLCFIKNYLATRFLLKQPSPGRIKPWRNIILYITYYISYDWRISYVSHFMYLFYSILYIFTILSNFHTKRFILFNTISLCKSVRPLPSCDVEFLNSCFYRAWWCLCKPKPDRQILFNKVIKSVGFDIFFSVELKYITRQL